MLNFNGNDLSNDIRVTDVVRPILPPSLLTTSKIVGRPGEFLHYKQHGSYTIPVSFIIIESKNNSLRNKVRELADKLDTDLPAPLIFSDEPDKYIDAIVSEGTDLAEIVSIGKGTINFYCPDPYWYAIEDDIIESNTSGIIEFVRKGTAESFPLIEIKGTNNGSITIENEDTKMTYTGKLGEGETLCLDTKYITAYIIDSSGNTRSVVDELDNLDFPVLKKGKNFLGIISNGGTTITNIKITCRSRWK